MALRLNSLMHWTFFISLLVYVLPECLLQLLVGGNDSPRTALSLIKKTMPSHQPPPLPGWLHWQGLSLVFINPRKDKHVSAEFGVDFLLPWHLAEIFLMRGPEVGLLHCFDPFWAILLDLFVTILVLLHTLEQGIRQRKLHVAVLLSRAGCRLRIKKGFAQIDVLQSICPAHLKRSSILFWKNKWTEKSWCGASHAFVFQIMWSMYRWSKICVTPGKHIPGSWLLQLCSRFSKQNSCKTRKRMKTRGFGLAGRGAKWKRCAFLFF